MLISISQFIPPLLSSLGAHIFVLYICVSISILQIRSTRTFFTQHCKATILQWKLILINYCIKIDNIKFSVLAIFKCNNGWH